MKPNREKTIEAYRKFISKKPKKARDLIKKLDYKKDHYLLFCIANTYWEEERLRLAERFVIKAFKINQDCSFVLWLLGMVKWDYGQYDAVIYSFEDIVKLGVKGIIKHGCTDDVAKAQVNDSKFQLYRLLKTNNPSLAKKYLSQFKNGLKQGIFTAINIKSNKFIKENIKLDDISPSQLQFGK